MKRDARGQPTLAVGELRPGAGRTPGQGDPSGGAAPDAGGTFPREDLEGVTAESPARYEGRHEIGRGATGHVWSVFDRHLRRTVARKELRPELSPRPGTTSGYLERFLREARVTAQLEHPGIVPVHELGTTADGRVYYTMKEVRGRSLADALAACQGLADRLALLDRFVDACQAVGYAHDRGVLHRDLKPENVMLGDFGETMVVDWGLARALDESEPRVPDLGLIDTGEPGATGAGAVLGTPLYMSPEQARGEALGPGADVWSLGVILWEICAGETLHEGREVLALVRAGRVRPLLDVAPAVPAELATITHKALAAQPEDRYPSAAALADDVLAWQRGQQVRAHVYTVPERIARLARRHRGAFLVASWSALILLVVTGALVVQLAAEGRRAQLAEQQESLARNLAEFNVLRLQAALAEQQGQSPEALASWRAAAALAPASSLAETLAAVHRVTQQTLPSHALVLPERPPTDGRGETSGDQTPGAPPAFLGDGRTLVLCDGRGALLAADLGGGLLRTLVAGLPGACLETLHAGGTLLHRRGDLPEGEAFLRLGPSGPGEDLPPSLTVEARWPAPRLRRGDQALSADGHEQALVTAEGAVELRRTADGTLLRTWPARGRGARLVALGGPLLAVAWRTEDGGVLEVIDPAAGRTLGETPLAGAPSRLSSSPGAPRFLLGTSLGSVVAWDGGFTTLDAGRPPCAVSDRCPLRVRATAVGAEPGIYAAEIGAAAEGRLVLWRGGTPVLSYPLSDLGSYSPLVYSPDGNLLAAVGNGDRTHLFDARSGTLLRLLGGHGAEVDWLAFAPDSARLAAAGATGPVRTWELSTVLAASRQAPAGPVPRAGDRTLDTVRISPDGREVTQLTREGEVRRWEAATLAPRASVPLPEVAWTEWTDEGLLLGRRVDGEDRLERYVEGLAPTPIARLESSVTPALYGTRGVLAGTDADGCVRLARPEALVACLADGPALALRMDPAGEVLAVSTAAGWRAGRVADWPTLGALSPVFTDESARLLVPAPDGVRWWVQRRSGSTFLDPRSGAVLAEVPGATQAISAALSSDGRILAWSSSGDLVLREVGGTAGWRSPLGKVEALAFSPSGGRIAARHGDDLVVVDAATGFLVQRTPVPDPLATHVRWADEETVLVLSVAPSVMRIAAPPFRPDDAVADAGRRTNFRVCQGDWRVVPVLPWPAPEAVWAPPEACKSPG